MLSPTMPALEQRPTPDPDHVHAVEPVEIPRRLDAGTWGLFFVWVGIALAAELGWGIGLLGLTLATVGVFGVFAYAVEERRREIGVRLALGARAGQIVRMLLSTSGRAMLGGLALGMIASLACGPLLRAYLLGLSPLDPAAYGLAAGLMAFAALLATILPARRATRIDPALTLRED